MTQNSSFSKQIVPTNYGELALITLLMFVVTTCLFWVFEYGFDVQNPPLWNKATKRAFFISFAYVIFFHFRRKNSEKVIFKSAEGEVILQEGFAQYSEKWYRSLSGKLFLTDKRMVFKSNKSSEISIRLEEIEHIHYNYLLGFIPNGIKISTKDANYVFSPDNQDFWRNTLETNLKLKN